MGHGWVRSGGGWGWGCKERRYVINRFKLSKLKLKYLLINNDWSVRRQSSSLSLSYKLIDWSFYRSEKEKKRWKKWNEVLTLEIVCWREINFIRERKYSVKYKEDKLRKISRLLSHVHHVLSISIRDWKVSFSSPSLTLL